MKIAWLLTFIAGACISLIIASVAETFCGIPLVQAHRYFIRGLYISGGISLLVMVVSMVTSIISRK
jgi:hypothetical protein